MNPTRPVIRYPRDDLGVGKLSPARVAWDEIGHPPFREASAQFTGDRVVTWTEAVCDVPVRRARSGLLCA